MFLPCALGRAYVRRSRLQSFLRVRPHVFRAPTKQNERDELFRLGCAIDISLFDPLSPLSNVDLLIELPIVQEGLLWLGSHVCLPRWLDRP